MWLFAEICYDSTLIERTLICTNDKSLAEKYAIQRLNYYTDNGFWYQVIEAYGDNDVSTNILQFPLSEVIDIQIDFIAHLEDNNYGRL